MKGTIDVETPYVCGDCAGAFDTFVEVIQHSIQKHRRQPNITICKCVMILQKDEAKQMLSRYMPETD